MNAYTGHTLPGEGYSDGGAEYTDEELAIINRGQWPCNTCGEWAVEDEGDICPACLEKAGKSHYINPDARMRAFRRIVNRHQWEWVDGVMIDALTAHAICLVYDKCNPEVQAAFKKLTADKMGQVAWSKVK